MRFAQPVLRRMLRTWLAAVCSLIDSELPTCRLLKPLGDEAEDLRLARREAVRQPRRRRRRAERADAAQQRGHPDALGERRGLARAAPRPGRARRRDARAASARTRTRCARARSRRPCGGSSAIARSKCALGAVGVAERRREHAEEAVGGAVAGDEVADHRRSRRRTARARGTASPPRPRRRAPRTRRSGRRAIRARATRGTGRARPASSARARAARRPPCPARRAGPPARAATGPCAPGSSASSRIDRRQLGEPALLAAQAEHLDPVDARGVAPGQQLPHSSRAPRRRLGLGEPPVAQRDRGAVVLGDVERRTAARCARDRRAARRPRAAPTRGRRARRAPARATPSPRRAARSRRAPRRCPCASVTIARISSSAVVPRDQYERISTVASPARSLEPARHRRSRSLRTTAPALAPALEVERARQPAEQRRRAARSPPRPSAAAASSSSSTAPRSAMPGRQHASS